MIIWTEFSKHPVTIFNLNRPQVKSQILNSKVHISEYTTSTLYHYTVVGRGVLTIPILWRPSYIAYPLFQILSNPPPCHLQPLPPMLFLLSCFFDLMGDCVTFDVLFCLMILQIHTCQTLVPQYQKDLDVCFMQQDLTFTEVWDMWFFAGTLIWYYTHTNTHPYTQHTQGPVDWHPYKYIFTPPVMYSQQLSLLHWMNN